MRRAAGPGPERQAERTGRAARVLQAAFGGPAAAVGCAPGRVTLIGDHVDYVGGRIACMAVDLALAVAVRPSVDGQWRVASGGRQVERLRPSMAGDIGDRVFAAAVALQRLGLPVPPVEAGVDGDLPAAAGLSSSAAVVTGTVVALLRLLDRRLEAEAVVAASLSAERDIVGVPCGELDQRAIVHSRAGSVLILDCARASWRRLPWPWPGIGVLVAASGESHDVGGAEYRQRRDAAAAVCASLGAGSCQEIGDRWRELPAELQPRGRHIATETRRSDAAAAALEAADAAELGRLMDESHQSLRQDCEVSTSRLDAMVHAVRAVRGCFGARLTGAGFGGSIIALVERSAAARCAAAVARVGSPAPRAWLLAPADGLEVSAADVVIAASDPGTVG
ncbi:MAG TPA: galactokinase family protein [Candidatus Binatia bacterium]|nr:galactokinase family protein [Candidatus Binatia bacterium]